jgi:hypothetical protein
MRTPFRMLAIATASLAAFALATGPAFAGNPHFVKASASPSGFDISVTFKEAGLPSGAVETVQAGAGYTAVFQCINGGHKNPSAANKSEESGSATVSGTFAADRNGNINGSLTISAPTTSTNALVCPNGQREQLSQITWNGVTLDDLTSGAHTTIPLSFTVGEIV